MLSISCNLLATVLKVKNRIVGGYRMDVSVLVVDPRDCTADCLLWLSSLPSTMKEYHTTLSPVQEKIKFKIRNKVSTACVLLSHHHKVKKS